MTDIRDMLRRYSDQRIEQALRTGDLPSLTLEERRTLRDRIDAELRRRGEPVPPGGHGEPRRFEP